MPDLPQNSKITNQVRSITSTESKEPSPTTKKEPKKDSSSHLSPVFTIVDYIMIAGGNSLTLTVFASILVCKFIQKVYRTTKALRKRYYRSLKKTETVCLKGALYKRRTMRTQRNSFINTIVGKILDKSTVNTEISSQLSVSTEDTIIRCNPAVMRNTAVMRHPAFRRTIPEPAYESEFYCLANARGQLIDTDNKSTPQAIIFQNEQKFGLLVYSENHSTSKVNLIGRHKVAKLPPLARKIYENKSIKDFFISCLGKRFLIGPEHEVVLQTPNQESEEGIAFSSLVKEKLDRFPYCTTYYGIEYYEEENYYEYYIEDESSYEGPNLSFNKSCHIS